MHTYLIKHKVSTLAELINNFNYQGYNFSSYSPEYWKSKAWVVSRTIEAEHAGHARFKFINELLPTIEQCSVVSQCAFRIVANTYFIYRIDENPKKTFYVHYVRPSAPVGLHFDNDEVMQLDKFNQIENKSGFFFLADAANASTYYTRLAMLIMAMEGLAGQITERNQVRTNTVVLREILGEELFERLYSYGAGLRNKLFHGNLQEHSGFEGLGDTVYAKIVSYLHLKYDIDISESVVHPMRNIHDNYEYSDTFLEFISNPVEDFKELEDAVKDLLDSNVRRSETITFSENSHDNY